MLEALHARNAAATPAALKCLQQIAVQNGNLFAELMETVKTCSLGQITNALFEVGEQYQWNMQHPILYNTLAILFLNHTHENLL
jgi:methylmalonyl-CoA mutase